MNYGKYRKQHRHSTRQPILNGLKMGGQKKQDNPGHDVKQNCEFFSGETDACHRADNINRTISE
jgi:hypothetical protein